MLADRDFELPDIPGWLTPGEGELLYRQAARCSLELAIVEIGAFKGKSTVCLARGSMAGQRAKVYSIDPHEETDSLEEFRANIRSAGVEEMVEPIVATSEEASRSWDSPIGLLFIDGNHDLEYVVKDCRLWFQHVAEGGFVALHDSTASWKAGLGGYIGPQIAVDRYFFFSRSVDRVGFIDTTSFAFKGKPGFSEYPRRVGVRLAKVPGDLLLYAENLVISKLGPLQRLKRKGLNRS